MGKFFEYVPQIIEAAAKSERGIIALVLLILAFLSFFFFRQRSWQVQMTAFVLIFILAIGAFVLAVIKKTEIAISPNYENNNGSNWNPFAPTYRVQPYQLINDYLYDRVTARLRYTGNLVEIIFPYQGVAECQEGKIYCLKIGYSSYIVLYFPSSRNDQVTRLAREVQKGQTIAVKGQVDGAEYQKMDYGSEYVVVLVKNCEIVRLPSPQFQP